MPDVSEIVKDADFKQLDPAGKRDVLDAALAHDSDYQGLEQSERAQIRSQLFTKYASVPQAAAPPRSPANPDLTGTAQQPPANQRQVSQPKSSTAIDPMAAAMGALAGIKPQAKAVQPSLGDQARAIRQQNALANEEQGRQHQRDLLAPYYAVADPASHLLSMGIRGVNEAASKGIAAVGRKLGMNVQSSISPLQAEINRQQAGQNPLQRSWEEDPGGFGVAVSPDTTRKVEAMPSTGGMGALKAVAKAGMGLATVDNVAIMLATHAPGTITSGAAPLIQKAVSGYFGKEMATGAAASIKKWKDSGYTDAEALTTGALYGVMGAAIATHMAGQVRESAKINALATAILDNAEMHGKAAPLDPSKLAEKFKVDPDALQSAIDAGARKRGMAGAPKAQGPVPLTPAQRTAARTAQPGVHGIQEAPKTATPEPAPAEGPQTIPLTPDQAAEVARRSAARRPVTAPVEVAQPSEVQTRPTVPPAAEIPTEQNVAPTQVRPKGETNATSTGAEQGGVQPERSGIGQQWTATEASPGNRVQPTEQGRGNAKTEAANAENQAGKQAADEAAKANAVPQDQVRPHGEPPTYDEQKYHIHNGALIPYDHAGKIEILDQGTKRESVIFTDSTVRADNQARLEWMRKEFAWAKKADPDVIPQGRPGLRGGKAQYLRSLQSQIRFIEQGVGRQQPFSNWVRAQPHGEIYTKATDLLQAWRKDNPGVKITEPEFAQMLHDLPREEWTPTSPSRSTKFVAKGASGQPVQMAGISRTIKPGEGGIRTISPGKAEAAPTDTVPPVVRKPVVPSAPYDPTALPAVRTPIDDTKDINLDKPFAYKPSYSRYVLQAAKLAMSRGARFTEASIADFARRYEEAGTGKPVPERLRAQSEVVADEIAKGKLKTSLEKIRAQKAKDAALQEKGPQELHSGIPLGQIIKKAVESPAGQSVRDFLFGDKPALTATSKPGLHAVNQHENARVTANLEADETLPRVTAGLTPEDRAKFLTYGVADRMLSLRDRLDQRVANASAKAKAATPKIAAARVAEGAAIASGDAKAIRKAQSDLDSARKESRDAMAVRAEAQTTKKNISLERAKDPLTVTMPDGKSHIVTEKAVEEYFARPEIKEAVARHADAEALLHRNQYMQGGQAAVSVGKHSGSYFPAEVLDAEGNIRRGIGVKGGRHAPSATMARNVNENEFTGSASSYGGNYDEVMRSAMESTYSRATERRMHDTLLREGVEQVFEPDNPNLRRSDNGKLEIKVNGNWEPGVDFTIQRGQAAVGVGGRTEMLPQQVVLPTRIYNEMAPLFDRNYQSATQKLTSSWLGRYMQAYLLKPADMVQHGAALSSRSTYGALRAPMTEFKRTAKAAVAVAQSTANFIRFFNPNLYKPETRMAALKFASETGILPSEFGGHEGTAYQLGRATGALRRGAIGQAVSDVGKITHNKLYGDQGILANAATSVYNEFERSGALKTEQGRTMLRDALRETFNTQGPTDQAQLSEGLRRLGLGTFYETGIKNRTAAVSAGANVYAASLAGRSIITIGLVKAVSGLFPWQIPGYKWGYVPIGKDDDGRILYIDGKLLDRVGFYPDVWVQAVLDSITRKLGAKGSALTAAGDFANWAMAPVASGPLLQGASATAGPIPNVHPNRDLSGLEFGSSSLTKYGYTWKRGAGVASSVLPFAGLAYDPAQEAMAGEPKNEKWRMANRILPFLGIPPTRAGQDAQVLLLNSARSEKARAKTEQKAEAGNFNQRSGRGGGGGSGPKMLAPPRLGGSKGYQSPRP